MSHDPISSARVDPPDSVHPGAPLSSPRQAARDSASPSLPQPVGGYPSDAEICSTLTEAVETLVWTFARRDYRRSADLLERLASAIQESSETDRREAGRRRRREPPPPSALERAREELHGAYALMIPATLDEEHTRMVRSQMASALALLEDIGR